MAEPLAAAADPVPRRGARAPLRVTTDVTPAAWDTFVRSHPSGTADHLWNWRTIVRDVFGHDSVYLAASDDRGITGVLPLVRFNSRLFGRSIVSLPFLNYGGVLASGAEAASLLLEHAGEVAREFRASHVELRHREQQFPDLPCRRHKLELTRPLATTTDALWDALDRKVRNQVRKAQKDGLTAEIGGGELAADFYAVFSQNMRDLGTPVYSRALFRETLRAFPDAARVHVVRSGRVPVAASISIRHRDTVLVPWASSLRAYRQHAPNMLLYWSMMEHAVQSGALVFDFGRSSPGTGPHQFKRQWGAEERPLAWEYVLLTRTDAPDHGAASPRFARAVKAWSHLPLWFANLVGPAIVRNIP